MSCSFELSESLQPDNRMIFVAIMVDVKKNFIKIISPLYIIYFRYKNNNININ